MALVLGNSDRSFKSRGQLPSHVCSLTTVAFLAVLGIIALAAQQTLPSAGTRVTPASSTSHERMLTLLQQIADEAADANPYTGSGQTRRLREELDALPVTTPNPNRWLVTIRLADEELRLGNEAEAISLFTRARNLLPLAGADQSRLNYNLFRLGVAYMRLGETQNCALHPTADSCILPIRGDGIHREQNPSLQAIAAFVHVLENTPDPIPDNLAIEVKSRNLDIGTRTRDIQSETTSLNLSARWLLNIAFMTIGGYPDQVPEPYLLPPRAFESGNEIPRFVNIAPTLDLATFDMSGGVIAEDFDNDGYLDIVVSTWDVEGQIRFFRNNQNGTFSERTEEAGLLGLYGGLNIIQADYDNDGNIDIFVPRGAWLREHGRHPNSLLRNNGGGQFTDVTFEAGLGNVHYPSQTASWGDYDNDGDLDLYVGNETSRTLRAPSQLFRNNGDGTFTDLAPFAGVMNHGYAKAVIWGDYNGDRLLDLYVSNSGGNNRLYRNTGRGTFVDEARRLGVSQPIESFPAWFWDFDNDGTLDLYVAAYVAGIEHLAASALELPINIELAHLYRGTTEGRFEEVSGQYNLVRPNAAMGANFGDLDNDGYLDFYLGTGYPPYHSLMPSVMYRNQNGTGFSDVTYAGGFGHLQKGHGVFFADLDHDGDQDIFEQMGGAFPGDRFGNVLYENPGFGNHWITIKLVGTRSNRSAIGARIRVNILESGIPRSIYRHVNSGGSFGANPLRQTIGLGKAARIETLEVFWPTTGLTQHFTDLPVDQIVQIVEGEASHSTVNLRTIKLGS